MEFPYVYENSIRITSYHVDCDEVLSLPMLFCLCQDTALNHVTDLDIGWRFLSARNLFWALSKMHVRINRLPRWNEEILIRTWGRPHDVYTQPRDFEILDAKGERIILVTSIWIILDAEEGKFQPLAQFDDKLFERDSAVMTERAPKVRMMPFEKEKAHFSQVLFSDLDRNHHVNNTKYLQWLFDSPDFANRKVTDLQTVSVNFIAQARLGETYALQTIEMPSHDLISTVFTQDGAHEYCRIQTQWCQQ